MMTKHTRSEESQESQINMSYELGEEGAVKALFTYYLRMRNGNLPKISREIPAEFIRIQKEILKVVELRKQMQNSLQLQAMAAARSETIMMLLDKCKEREKTVDELAGEIVVMNTNYAQGLVTRHLQQQQKVKQIPEQAQPNEELIKSMNALGCKIHLLQDRLLTEEPIESGKLEKGLDAICEQQRERMRLSQSICSTKQRYIELKQQLLEQREKYLEEGTLRSNLVVDSLLKDHQQHFRFTRLLEAICQDQNSTRNIKGLVEEAYKESEEAISHLYEIELTERKYQLKRLTESVGQLEEIICEKDQQIKRLRTQMSEKVLAINELNEQLLTLSNQFNESERRYLAQGATLERKQQQYCSLLTERREQIENISEELSKKQLERQTQKAKNAKLAAVVCELQLQNSNWEQQIRNCHIQQNLAAGELNHLKLTLQLSQEEWRARLFSMQLKVDEKTEQLYRLSHDAAKSSLQIRGLNKEIMHLSVTSADKIRKLQQQIDELQAQVAAINDTELQITTELERIRQQSYENELTMAEGIKQLQMLLLTEAQEASESRLALLDGIVDRLGYFQ